MSADATLTVVIAGGGTGGHLYPGIAVARELLRRVPSARISFAGTSAGLEARVIPREGFELDVIRSAGLKGKTFAARMRGARLVPLGLLDAWRIITRRRPLVVIGVGGYSAGPVVLTAACRGVATMVLEQNAQPGLTNRMLARWVRAAAVNFEQTLAYFHGRGFVAGNPVRREFFDAAPPRERSSTPAASAAGRVLIVGGSQGAHGINLAMAAAASSIRAALPGISIVHQTGQRDLQTVTDAYQRAGLDARVAAFLDPVLPEMRAADLIICRAGATTLAELAALGVPAILVPLPTAADDHQRKNASVLAHAGAAVVIEERDLAATLTASVAGLLSQPDRLAAMGRAMRAFARPDAAARVVDRVLALAGSR